MAGGADRRKIVFRPDTYDGWGRLLWRLSEEAIKGFEAATKNTQSPSDAFENYVSDFRDRAMTVGIAADIVWVSADDDPFEIDDRRFGPYLSGRSAEDMDRMYSLQLSECGRKLLRLVAPLAMAVNALEDVYLRIEAPPAIAVNALEDLHLSVDEKGSGRPTRGQIRSALANLRRLTKELKQAYPLKRRSSEIKTGVAKAIIAVSEQGVMSFSDLVVLTGVPKQRLHESNGLQRALDLARENAIASTVSLVAHQPVLPSDPDSFE